MIDRLRTMRQLFQLGLAAAKRDQDQRRIDAYKLCIKRMKGIKRHA